MSKKTVIYTVLILSLALALSACERSASVAPLGTPTPGPSGSPQVAATSSDPMDMLRGFATQTAMALSGGATAQPGSATTPLAGTPMPAVTNTTPVVVATTAVPSLTPMSNTAIPANNTRPATYTLQEGEFPYCIARRYDVNPNELLNLNGLGSGGNYYAGLILKIPQTGNPFPGERGLLPRPASYAVTTGDTIYKIACKYGDIDPLTIAAVNSLVAPYTLKTGQIITIP
jgi:LysM repeat protein